MARTAVVLRAISLALLLACIAQRPLLAQESMGLRITALTSAERDSLAASARASGDLRMIYACVPAGLVVFATQGGTVSRQALRDQVASTLAAIIAPQRIEPEEITLHAAEAACEIARGQ